MSSLVKATKVWFDADSLWVQLSDGRTLSAPLAWFPKLLQASVAQRNEVIISTRGLHWEELDEDISVQGLLAGRGDRIQPKSKSNAA
ncbi:DUF2442 domain-containing protein [Mesorhizobium sp. 1B3]|uniref:DUF2442 domain-containing protein n=1 Tax=Mesorhizobium sp. 1B3 TaxID=3243599 RepID=UPI003D971A4B